MTADAPTRARSTPDPLSRYGVGREDAPSITAALDRVGPSYRVTIGGALRAELVFRDVRVDRDPAAEVQVILRGQRVFRTTSTLSLTGQDRLAKAALRLSSTSDERTWFHVIHVAAEAVMDAEEQLRGGQDLRTARAKGTGSLWIAGHFAVDGPTLMVMPREAGKSTFARALGVSIAAGREILPGIPPRRKGPVLYVAGEAAAATAHVRSVEAICKGAGIDREAIEFEVLLQPTFGKPLHRIARSLAERAHDFALVILDSQQALAATGESMAGIRERDTLFWHAIDELERPVLVISHPNRDDARRWDRSDGRAAGSDVTGDRARISWMGRWKDEKAVEGTSYRRYTLRCTKFNDGPRPVPLGIGVNWVFGLGDEDPGTVFFTEVEAAATPAPSTGDDPSPDSQEVSSRDDLPDAMKAALEAYEAGATTPKRLALALPGLSVAAAESRLKRLKKLLEDHPTLASQTTLETSE